MTYRSCWSAPYSSKAFLIRGVAPAGSAIQSFNRYCRTTRSTTSIRARASALSRSFMLSETLCMYCISRSMPSCPATSARVRTACFASATAGSGIVRSSDPFGPVIETVRSRVATQPRNCSAISWRPERSARSRSSVLARRCDSFAEIETLNAATPTKTVARVAATLTPKLIQSNPSRCTTTATARPALATGLEVGRTVDHIPATAPRTSPVPMNRKSRRAAFRRPFAPACKKPTNAPNSPKVGTVAFCDLGAASYVFASRTAPKYRPASPSNGKSAASAINATITQRCQSMHRSISAVIS
jgi:hypothetical protein